MTNLNGVYSLNASPRLRWIWFGGSILAERAGPLVSTNRLVIRELVERGQEVEYLEPANHPAFSGALRDEGSGFYRSFLETFPEIRYRRYDMPRPHERDVWMSREAALADVVIIEAGAPSEVFTWISRVEERSFVRILLADAASEPSPAFDLVLGPDGDSVRYHAISDRGEAASQVTRLLDAVAEVRARNLAERSQR